MKPIAKAVTSYAVEAWRSSSPARRHGTYLLAILVWVTACGGEIIIPSADTADLATPGGGDEIDEDGLPDCVNSDETAPTWDMVVPFDFGICLNTPNTAKRRSAAALRTARGDRATAYRHDYCADRAGPGNDYASGVDPGCGADAQIQGFAKKRNYDGWNVANQLVWEMKVYNWDTYTASLQEKTLKDSVCLIGKDFDLADKCGLSYVFYSTNQNFITALKQRVSDARNNGALPNGVQDPQWSSCVLGFDSWPRNSDMGDPVPPNCWPPQ